MSYVKQMFQAGQTLFAAQLNAMDDQISANETAIQEKVGTEQLGTALNEAMEDAVQQAKTGSVSYQQAQELSDEQKQQARENIGAADANTVETLDGVVSGKSYTERCEETIQVTGNISSNTQYFDVDIKTGEEYTLSLLMETVLFSGGVSAYEVDADGNKQAIGTLKESDGWKVTKKASLNVRKFALYVPSSLVTGTGTMTLSLSITRSAGESLIDQLAKLEEKTAPRTITNNHIRLFTDTVIRGHDGGAADYEGWISTDFVDMTSRERDTVTLNARLYSSFGVAFYDKNRSYISGVYGSNAADYGYTENTAVQNVTLPIPQGCCYLRATMGQSEYGNGKQFDITYPSLEEKKAAELPSYYHRDCYFEKKYNRIHQLMKTSMANGDAFVFITDEHWEGGNQGNSIGLIRRLNDFIKIPRLFSGGDTGDYGSEAFCRLLQENFSGDIHHVCGNHDYFNRDNQGATLFHMMDVGKENQVGNPGRHYYYVDNRQQKIRYVVLSAFDWDEGGSTCAAKNGYEEAQLQWLQNTALAVDGDWTVIVFTHSLITGMVETMDNAVTQAIDACNQNNNIVAILQGHAHYDWIAQTAGGIKIAVTTCDKNAAAEGADDHIAVRADGTIQEQAFDVCVLDKTARTLTMVRIGAPVMEGTTESDWTLSEERVISY